MKVELEVIEGPYKGKVFTFTEADCFLVGRDGVGCQAHFRLDRGKDMYVSRNHLLVEIKPPNVYIRDNSSKNGTYLKRMNSQNFERITYAQVFDGDEIKIGKTVFKVKIYPLEEISAYHCIRCGKEIDETADDLALCSECRRKQEEPKKPLTEKFFCSSCGADITSMANRDGKAVELKDVVFYLCKKCAEKEKWELPHGTPKNIDHYLILKELGRGGMGVVYKAWDEKTGRVVALKMILPHLLPEEKYAKKFLREIKTSSLVLHPNLVRYINGKASGTKVYFTMEFVKDGSLWDVFKRNNYSPLPVKFVCEIMLQALEGLDYLHSHPQKFIHRDLKPQNILLKKENGKFIAKIADFGLAKSAITAGISDITKTGEVAGTLLFMSPQQFLNFKNPKPHFDTYSIGVTFYLLIAGDYPFDIPKPRDIASLIQAILNGKPIDPIQIILDEKQKPVPVREKNPSIPEKLAQVIDKSVQKSPEKRFQNAKEFKEALIKAMFSHQNSSL